MQLYFRLCIVIMATSASAAAVAVATAAASGGGGSGGSALRSGTPNFSGVSAAAVQQQGVGTMGHIPSAGMADSTVAGRAAGKRAFELFLVEQNTVDPNWPATMNELTQRQANDVNLFERFAFFLTYTLEKGAAMDGGALALNTIKNYLRCSAQLLVPKHADSATGNTLSKLEAPNNWLSKIISRTERELAKQAVEDGTEVYFEHMDLN